MPGIRQPNSKRGRLRAALMDLIEEHRNDGMLPTSVRFLFYELVMRRVISKEQKRSDQDVSEALMDLRHDGEVDWDDIVDETREVSSFIGAKTVRDDLLRNLSMFTIDPWCGHVPFIICESRSLAGVLRELVGEYRCRIASTNGQSGGFLYARVAPLLTGYARTLRPDRVGYLGDLDLSGGHIEANTRRVLESEVSKASPYSARSSLEWTRLAVTEEQVEEYDLPRVRKRDKRFNDGGGVHEAVETEALSQSLIVEIVRDWLDALLERQGASLEEVHAREQSERVRIERALRRIRE